MRLQRVISINRENHRKDKIVELVDAERVRTERDQRESSPVVGEENEVRNAETSGYGESFGDLVQNMDGVQDVLMDGIMEEMETEGRESDGQNHNEDQHSLAEEGYAVTSSNCGDHNKYGVCSQEKYGISSNVTYRFQLICKLLVVILLSTQSEP